MIPQVYGDTFIYTNTSELSKLLLHLLSHVIVIDNEELCLCKDNLIFFLALVTHFLCAEKILEHFINFCGKY